MLQSLPPERGDEGRRRSVPPSSRVTGEGNARERQGEEQPDRAGPLPTGQSGRRTGRPAPPPEDAGSPAGGAHGWE